MTANDLAAALLTRTALFGTLGEAERRSVASEMRPATFEAGQQIFARGDAGREIYLVTDGRVRLSVLTAEGRELSFKHAEPGHIFGEIAMLDGGGRSADATAVVKTRAMTLAKPQFMRLMQAHPAIVDNAMKFLCSRIRDADEQLEAIALFPIEGRLARFFLAAAQARGAIDRTPSIEVPLEMSQGELALLIGASRPKVNTALSMLEASGALKRSGTRFICVIEELRAIAGRD